MLLLLLLLSSSAPAKSDVAHVYARARASTSRRVTRLDRDGPPASDASQPCAVRKHNARALSFVTAAARWSKAYGCHSRLATLLQLALAASTQFRLTSSRLDLFRYTCARVCSRRLHANILSLSLSEAQNCVCRSATSGGRAKRATCLTADVCARWQPTKLQTRLCARARQQRY